MYTLIFSFENFNFLTIYLFTYDAEISLKKLFLVFLGYDLFLDCILMQPIKYAFFKLKEPRFQNPLKISSSLPAILDLHFS